MHNSKNIKNNKFLEKGKSGHPQKKRDYLNINCSYECWDDCKFPIIGKLGCKKSLSISNFFRGTDAFLHRSMYFAMEVRGLANYDAGVLSFKVHFWPSHMNE